MTNLNLTAQVAEKLAEAIYDHIDYYGITELDIVTDLLAGEISIEQFIRDTEARMAEVSSLRKEGN